MKQIIVCSIFFLAVIFNLGCKSIVKENSDSIKNISIAQNITYNKQNYPLYMHSLNSSNEYEEFLYEKPPQRIIAIWQNSIETLLALGAGDRIVAGIGIPDRKYLLPEYQEAYDKIPYTSFENLDLETIIMMHPDFILGWYSTFNIKVLRNTEFWKKRNVNCYIAPSSVPFTDRHILNDEYQYILDIGKIVDKEERAFELVQQIKDEISFVSERTENIGYKPKVLIIEIVGKEMRVYGKDTLAGDIVRSLHGELLDLKGSIISMEQLREIDPDTIFLVLTESQYDNKEINIKWIKENKALKRLKCVREDRLYTVPLYSVYSSGIRTLDGVRTIAHGLYPELYGE